MGSGSVDEDELEILRINDITQRVLPNTEIFIITNY